MTDGYDYSYPGAGLVMRVPVLPIMAGPPWRVRRLGHVMGRSPPPDRFRLPSQNFARLDLPRWLAPADVGFYRIRSGLGVGAGGPVTPSGVANEPAAWFRPRRRGAGAGSRAQARTAPRSSRLTRRNRQEQEQGQPAERRSGLPWLTGMPVSPRIMPLVPGSPVRPAGFASARRNGRWIPRRT